MNVNSNRDKPESPAEVIVTIKGGTVVEVQSPETVRVTIRDYDTDGVESEALRHDEDGEPYVLRIWE